MLANHKHFRLASNRKNAQLQSFSTNRKKIEAHYKHFTIKYKYCQPIPKLFNPDHELLGQPQKLYGQLQSFSCVYKHFSKPQLLFNKLQNFTISDQPQIF